MHMSVAEPRSITSLAWTVRLGRSLLAHFRVVGMEDLATFFAPRCWEALIDPLVLIVNEVDHDKTTVPRSIGS
jgi:hypothetical protein